MDLVRSTIPRLLAVLFLASMMVAAPLRAAEAGAPQTIEALHAALIQVMKQADELGFSGRLERVQPAVEAAFDLDFMASKTLGPHSKKLGDADRQRWVTTFKRFVASNYARQFDGYSGQKFETLEVEAAPRETVIVRTVLVRSNDEDVKLNYRLQETEVAPSAEQQDGAEGEPTWKIIDVYSNGTVSELALRRSEFSALLSRNGFEGLIARVEDKSAKE